MIGSVAVGVWRRLNAFFRGVTTPISIFTSLAETVAIISSDCAEAVDYYRNEQKECVPLTVIITIVGGYLLSHGDGLDNSERDVTSLSKQFDVIAAIMLDYVA
jgi:hypothetical protein